VATTTLTKSKPIKPETPKWCSCSHCSATFLYEMEDVEFHMFPGGGTYKVDCPCCKKVVFIGIWNFIKNLFIKIFNKKLLEKHNEQIFYQL
jgi:hypothetical protein